MSMPDINNHRVGSKVVLGIDVLARVRGWTWERTFEDFYQWLEQNRRRTDLGSFRSALRAYAEATQPRPVVVRFHGDEPLDAKREHPVDRP